MATAEATPMGILVGGAASNLEILDNDIHHIQTNSTRSDGAGHYVGNAHAIAVYGTSSTAISNLVIRGNDVHDNKLGTSEPSCSTAT